MKKTNWPSALVLSLVLSLSITGCGKPSAEAQLQKARDYMAKGEKKAAIIEFKNLLADHPDNADARRQLGQLYLETGETDAALIELKKAVEYGADEANTASSLAKVLLAKGDFAKVLDYLDPKKIPAVANNPSLIVLRGNAFAGRGMLDDAGKAYAEALKIDPKFADASIGLARLELTQRKADVAIAVLDGVLASTPGSSDALIMKADILRSKGDKSAAKDLYLRALAADKAKVQAYLGLIGLELESGQVAEARKYLQSAQKLSPDNIYVRHLEAMILLQEKQPEQALSIVLEVLKAAPSFAAANMLAANIEFSKGLYQQSAAHLNAVLARSPNSLSARRLLAAILYKQNELEKASALLVELMERYPDDASVFTLAGEVFAKKKDYAKSMAAYARASQLKPQNSDLLTKLAMSRMATGDADKAMSDLESIAAGDANAFQADIILALAHINKKEWKQAEVAVARLAKKQPESPLPGSLRASIAIGKNDSASARKELDGVLANHPGFVPAAVNLARLDLQEKQPERAQKRFESLLAKDPKSIGVMMAYAEFLLAINKPADAQPWLEKAHQIQPEAVEPSLALTALAMRNKDFKRAQAIAQEALAKKPDTPQLLDNLASVQLAAGEQNQALATLAKLVKAMPNSPLVYLKLANAQMFSGNNAGAIESLQKTIALAPNTVDAYVLLSRLYLRNKQPAEAMKTAQTLQRLQPKSASGYLLEGDVHMQAKAAAEAAAAYQRANAVEPSSVGMISRHRTLVVDGKRSQADAEVEKWLGNNPNEIPTRTYLAEQGLQNQQFAKAAGYYEALAKLQPNNPLLLNNLAYCYQQLKSPKARETAEAALKLAPNNPEIMDTLAMIHVDGADLPKALELLKRALDADKANLEIRFHYAQVLLKANRKSDAVKELEYIKSTGRTFSAENEMLELLKKLK